MAGQGHFNPNMMPGVVYGNPTVLISDQDQPVYPMDYRQYPGYVSSRQLGLPRLNQPQAGFDMTLNNRNFFSTAVNSDFNDSNNIQAFVNVPQSSNMDFSNNQRKNALIDTYDGADFQAQRDEEKSGISLQNKIEQGASYRELELGEVRSVQHGNMNYNRHLSPTNSAQPEFNYLLKDDPIEEVSHATQQNTTALSDEHDNLKDTETSNAFSEENSLNNCSSDKNEEENIKMDIKIEIDNAEEGVIINEETLVDVLYPVKEGSYSDADTIIDEYDETPVKKGKQKKKLETKNQSEKLKEPKPKEKKEFKCDTCSRMLNSARALEKHINLHTGAFSCDICKKFCNSQTSLDTHAKVHQGYMGNEVCNVCDKKFYDKSSLNKHTLSVHMGIKNFQCSYCDLSFYARKTYEEHIRVHTGERPFKCEICPKTYKRISDLNHHIRLHKGETSHTCEVCGEGFRRTSELKRHKLKHETTDESGNPTVRIHQCEWCGVQFNTASAMTVHIKTHFENIGARNRISGGKPDMFNMEKQKLVNEILGINKIGEPFLSDRIGLMGKFQPGGLNFGKEVTVGGANFGKSLQEDSKSVEQNADSRANNQIVSQDGKRVGTPENTKDISNTKIDNIDKDTANGIGDSNNDKNDINAMTTSQVNHKTDKPEEFKSEGIEIKKEPVDYDYDDNYDMGNDNDSSDDDRDYNPAQDKYGSDTEIEDYTYVLQDMKWNEGESSNKKKRQKKVSMKRKVKNKTKNKGTFAENDEMDNTNDPSFEIEEGTKKKIKGRKSKKVVKTCKDNADDPDFIAEDETKKKVKSTEPSSFICEECGKFFSRKACFQKHMNLHTGIFTCGLCSKSFASQNSFDLHMDNHEGKRTKTATCKVCDKSYYDHSSLNKHVKNVHMNWRPFPCSDCDLRFSEKKTLVEHIRTHTGERPFKCTVCERTFKRQSELNFHTKKHTGETKLTCSECGQGFRRQSELKTHMIIKHTGEKPFMCSFCGRKFMSNAMLKEHVLTHSSQKSFECEKCGKGFHSKFKLGKHMRIKTDCSKMTFEMVNGVCTCKYCCSEFTSISELQVHIYQMHEGKDGIKTFNCKICWKEFSRSQALKRHLKIHAQQRDFKCHECGASFIQKHHLTQHLRTHSGEKPFQCHICLKSFAQSATLYSHLKHH